YCPPSTDLTGKMLKKYSMRTIECPCRKKQRACEQLPFACPPRPDLKTILSLFFFSGARIQEQRSVVSDLGEVKHLGDGVGERIEGALADALSAEPVVFDEPGNRSLVGNAVVHEVLPRPWRDH